MARRAVINGPGAPLRFEDYEVPEIPAGHIRIRITHSGVCHSDVHLRKDEKSAAPPLREIFGEDAFKKIVLGHEIAGLVDEFASDLDVKKSNLAKGDRVVVYPWLGCQKCSACSKGKTNNCKDQGMILHAIGIGPHRPGGYQTHLVVDPKFVLKVPETVPLDLACLLACSGGTAFSALQKLRESVEFGAYAFGKPRVLIIGAGGLGLWAVKLGRIMYGDKAEIIVADLDAEKIETAKKYGADGGVLWSRTSTEEQNAQAVTKDGQVFGAIDFVGMTSTLSSGIQCLARNGTMVIVGLAGGVVALPAPIMITKQINVRGCAVFDMDQLRELLTLVEKQKITYPDIQHFSLDEVNTALELLEKGKIAGRAVLQQARI